MTIHKAMKTTKTQKNSLFSLLSFLGSGLMVLFGLSLISARALFGLGGGFAEDVLSIMGPGVAHADYTTSSGGGSSGLGGTSGGCEGGACTPGFACGISGSNGGGGGTGSGTGSCGGSCA